MNSWHLQDQVGNRKFRKTEIVFKRYPNVVTQGYNQIFVASFDLCNVLVIIPVGNEVGAIRESPLQDRMFFIWNDYN